MRKEHKAIKTRKNTYQSKYYVNVMVVQDFESVYITVAFIGFKNNVHQGIVASYF